MDPDHLSYSQISMFLRCPRQYEFRYVDGIIIPPAGALILGSAYHEALATNYTQKIKSEQDLPVNDVLDSFATHWDKQIKERVLKDGEELEEFDNIDWEGEKPGEMKDTGARLVTTYQDSVAPRIMPVAVEEFLSMEISGITYVGRLDLRDVNARVVDHKTAARSKAQSEVDTDLQPSSYGLLLSRPIDFDFHVAVKTKAPKIQIVSTRRTVDDIVWFVRLLRTVHGSICTGVFPPNPTGWWCNPKFCGYWDLCRDVRR